MLVLFIVCLLCSLHTITDAYAQNAAEDYIAASKSYQSKGDYNNALNELQEIGNISSLDDPTKKILLDEYILLSGNAINKSSRRVALAITEAAAKVFPEDKRVVIKHGKAQLAVGKYKEAVNAVGRFLLLEGGESKDPESFALGCANQGYGLELVEQGKVANAFELKVRDYQRAISADPEWFLPYLLLGATYISEKDYSKSQEYYEKGRTINPNGFSSTDYILLGSLYNENKLYQKVKDLLSDVPAEHPYWPGVHLYLGYAEENMGNLLGAFYQYNYEMFISGPEGYFFKPAQMSMANIIREINNDQKLQEKFPEVALLIKAGEAGANKDFKNSIAYYEKAMAIDPSPGPILYLLLGEAYMQNNDHDQAILYLKKMLELDSSFPPAYCEIGDMFADKGDLDNAIIWWEKGFNTDPENWKVKYTKGRLKSTKPNVGKFSEFLKKNNIE